MPSIAHATQIIVHIMPISAYYYAYYCAYYAYDCA